MGLSNRSESDCSVISNNTKVIALETSLQQSLVIFKDLVLDLEQLHIDSENYKLQYLSVKDKCENKTCKGTEQLKKIIATKDQIIQSVASTLKKFKETKNYNILTDAFKILCEDESPLTPPIEENPTSTTNSKKNISIVNENTNLKREADTSITEDVSFKEEESLCEIEGTPGRKSPIIQTRQTRSKTSAKSSDFRDKNKCPNNWSTSESKAIKLTYPTLTRSKSVSSGKVRLRQSRLNLEKLKQTTVVDLTCSPEVLAQKSELLVQTLIKKESIENDDTILPSPTSGPTNFTLLKTTSKSSPSKFKKPTLSLKSKSENVIKQDDNKDRSKNAANTDIEKSINNCAKRKRLQNGIKKEAETPVMMEVVEEDVTHCETNVSISLLQQVDQLEEEHRKIQLSPSKRPLAENINIMNTPPKTDAESSISILRPEPSIKTDAVENVKRKIPELVEPVYKEQAVRKKAEKRNLQGWSCEECMNFYGELYKNDPVMLAKKINECSKHRGKHNPARPKTPPNFWNPRWHVPEDTEELNRMNNAN